MPHRDRDHFLSIPNDFTLIHPGGNESPLNTRIRRCSQCGKLIHMPDNANDAFIIGSGEAFCNRDICFTLYFKSHEEGSESADDDIDILWKH